MGNNDRDVVQSRTMIIAVILAFMMAVHAIPVDLQLDKGVALDNDGNPCKIGHKLDCRPIDKDEEEDEDPHHATLNPTPTPTLTPTGLPTVDPTRAPTFEPTSEPTEEPTRDPTQNPKAEALDNDGNPCSLAKCAPTREGCRRVDTMVHGCEVCGRVECATSCTHTPTGWMKKKGKSCDMWSKENFSAKCNHNARWMKNKYCQQSCYLNGFGYDGDYCKR